MNNIGAKLRQSPRPCTPCIIISVFQRKTLFAETLYWEGFQKPVHNLQASGRFYFPLNNGIFFPLPNALFIADATLTLGDVYGHLCMVQRLELRM
jgi:hypothetical protein